MITVFGIDARSFVTSTNGAVAETQPALAPGAERRIDELMTQAMHDAIIPGAELAVVRADGTFLINKAYGDRTFEPHPVPNDPSTIYELASLTKPVATASAVMLLVQQGRLRLVDRVAKYLPAFGVNGKADVNVAELLTHTSGLAPDLAGREYHTEDLATILAHTDAAPLRSPPGTKFAYSDLGYIVLAQLIARISGESYDRFVDDHLFAPLGMRDSSIGTASDAAHAARIAPQTRNETPAKLRQSFGTVPGLYGHAGMLSTAGDLAKFAIAQLRALQPNPDPSAPLAPATVRAMISPRYVGGGAVRGLGWDLDTAYSNNRGDLLPRGGFGHTGSSGTSMWIDPALNVAIIFVSNAHYPDDIGTTLPLEGEIADVVASSLRDVDPKAIRAEQQAFDAAAARSALGFPRGF